jgi:hypothetical protein
LKDWSEGYQQHMNDCVVVAMNRIDKLSEMAVNLANLRVLGTSASASAASKSSSKSKSKFSSDLKTVSSAEQLSAKELPDLVAMASKRISSITAEHSESLLGLLDDLADVEIEVEGKNNNGQAADLLVAGWVNRWCGCEYGSESARAEMSHIGMIVGDALVAAARDRDSTRKLPSEALGKALGGALGGAGGGAGAAPGAPLAKTKKEAEEQARQEEIARLEWEATVDALRLLAGFVVLLFNPVPDTGTVASKNRKPKQNNESKTGEGGLSADPKAVSAVSLAQDLRFELVCGLG